jgi:predicted dehydrogenase
MKLRIAFAGFRHYHIVSLYNWAQEHSVLEIVGAAEDDAAAAEGAAERGVDITWPTVDAMFEDSDCYDIVAIGDYYTRRGALALRAVDAGKHVIVDKPLCTSLEELDELRAKSRQAGLAVSCMLNNRDSGQFRTVKRLLGEGAIGETQTINFMGQHPLNYGTRPQWYFEGGKHGGTINDIGIHAIDIIPWFSGQSWDSVVAARTWNTRLTEHPQFQVGAQMMLSLSNGAGVLGDVSYLSPNSQGYSVPQYWRYTIHGNDGIIETGSNRDDLRMWRDGHDSVEVLELDAGRPQGVYEDFLREITGDGGDIDLSSDQVFDSARAVLEVQKAADTGSFPTSIDTGE